MEELYNEEQFPSFMEKHITAMSSQELNEYIEFLKFELHCKRRDLSEAEEMLNRVRKGL